MGRMSREKGKRGERELARYLRGEGFDCRRNQQYNGAAGDADLVGLPGIHIECKRTEKLSLYEAMAQAKADARPGEKPVVFHRRNDFPWLVIMDISDFAEIYREWEAGR